MPEMTTQVTGSQAGDTAAPPMNTAAGMSDSPLSRAFDMPGDDLTGDVSDMTPSVGPCRGLASFWAGSQDAGHG